MPTHLRFYWCKPHANSVKTATADLEQQPQPAALGGRRGVPHIPCDNTHFTRCFLRSRREISKADRTLWGLVSLCKRTPHNPATHTLVSCTRETLRAKCQGAIQCMCRKLCLSLKCGNLVKPSGAQKGVCVGGRCVIRSFILVEALICTLETGRACAP